MKIKTSLKKINIMTELTKLKEYRNQIYNLIYNIHS